MTHSMTACASRTGHSDAISWRWDIRSVNGRGLDLRLRLPDGFDRLDATVRKALQKALHRGTVTVSLQLTGQPIGQDLQIDETRLDAVLRALDLVQDRAFSLGVTLGQPTAADVLSQRGVVNNGADGAIGADIIAAMTTDIGPLLAEFTAMRNGEGAALQKVISAHLDHLQDCHARAVAAVTAREPQTRRALRDAFARIMGEVTDADSARLTQELALIAVKQDVTEELDRLQTHLTAMWDVIDDDAPAGRKLDFLCQELMREANTLCAKSQNADLAALAIDMKTVIDRLREQVQNVE